MIDLVIGDQMGMATLESCAEADALAPNAPSVVPRAREIGEFTEVVDRDTGMMNAMGFRHHPERAEWVNDATGEMVSDEFLRLKGSMAVAITRRDGWTRPSVPKQAKSAAPRQCASWCGLPQKDERVETRLAFFAVKEPTIEDAAYCCPQRPEDVGLAKPRPTGVSVTMVGGGGGGGSRYG